MPEYILHIFIFIGIYSILSLSLNLLVGYVGILSVAHAAFYGVGAYVTAIMATKFQSPFLLNMLLSVIITTTLGALVGIPSLRIKNDYFIIATFAFQIIVFSTLNNMDFITGGTMGILGIPQPNIFGVKVSNKLDFLVFTWALVFITFFICRRLVYSPFGSVLKAIRENEVFAESLGKNVSAYKVKVFMISAGFASIAGVIYATYISYIDPPSFTIMESIFIISIVIIGGAGNLWGSILGAVVLVILPELLRFVGMPNSIAANMRQIFYGSLLVIFMIWRPQGFLGEYEFNQSNDENV